MKESGATEAQSIAVKRAQVEFHNFASLGQPEISIKEYALENDRRGHLIFKHQSFVGAMTPFLEIGANAGHSSYMMVNGFGADGFALDISADALRHGIFLMDHWGIDRAPVRVGGDALNLPFHDGSMRFVMTYQTMSQFLNLDAVIVEAKRVLAPGGVFLFAEEPIRRMLSLRLYRVPYYSTMKPWEKKLYDWGLLGFIVKDVIGAQQEEGFGIRQNHRMGLHDWHALVQKHFPAHEYEISIPQRGWAEKLVGRIGRRIDKYRSHWVPARLLGGTLSAFCKKSGDPPPPEKFVAFETYLRCPDCFSGMMRDASETLRCASCGYSAPNEGGVYNLIRSSERSELYPGDREDVMDVSQAGHASRLRGGWGEVEGVFGGKYRWLSDEPAVAVLRPVKTGPRRLRIRGHAHENSFRQGQPVRINVDVNGQALEPFILERNGLFVLEADVPDAREYVVTIQGSPKWLAPPDERVFTVNLGMLRLIDRG